MSNLTRSVLFVCTGNAGRSQMAEALCRAWAGARISASSAGVAPWPDLHPVAVRLMAERGISLSGHRPKHVESLRDLSFDWVITIGDPARQHTPDFPAPARRLHWPIDDPAEADGTPEQEAVFRRTLDRLEHSLTEFLSSVGLTVGQTQDRPGGSLSPPGARP